MKRELSALEKYYKETAEEYQEKYYMLVRENAGLEYEVRRLENGGTPRPRVREESAIRICIATRQQIY